MRHFIVSAVSALSLLSATGCSSPDKEASHSKDAGLPDVLDWNVMDSSAPDVEEGGLWSGEFDLGVPGTGPINYLGGPVLSQPINVYLIAYGNWNNSPSLPIIEDFISNLGSSQWWAVNTKYYQEPEVDGGGLNTSAFDASADVIEPPITAKGYVSSTMNLASVIYDPYSKGTDIGDDDVVSIVSSAINTGSLPTDPAGIYVVLTSSDVYEYTGFCWAYCAYHMENVINDNDIKIAYIGDTDQCQDACTAQPVYAQYGYQSPNNNWEADGIINVLAHELAEASNDPQVFSNLAWLTAEGMESGDLCAWVFGKPFETPAGTVANIQIGSKFYLVQENFELDTDAGHCALTP